MLYSVPATINPLIGPRTYRRRGLGSLGGPPAAVDQLKKRGTPASYLMPDGDTIWFTDGISWEQYSLSKLKQQRRPSPQIMSFTALSQQDVAPITFPAAPSGWRVFNEQSYRPWSTNAPVNGDYPPGTQSVYVRVGPNPTGATEGYLILDRVEAPLGRYLVKTTDLGSVTLSNGRTYQLLRQTLWDQRTGTQTDYYDTVEGGGGIHVFEKIAPTVARVVTDVGTFGQSEVLRAIDKDIAQKAEAAYTAGAVGGVTGLLTGGVISPGALGAEFLSGAVAGTGSGITGAIQGASAADIIAGGAQAGAIAGTVAGLLNVPTQPVPPPAGPTAPVDVTPPGMTPADTFVTYKPGPVTLTPDTAGATLLPREFSLIQPAPFSSYFPYIPPPFSNSIPLETYTSPSGSPGSTLLPPELSLNPTVPVAPGTTETGLLGEILNAGKVAVPGAISGYKLYQQLTAPKPIEDDGSGVVVFGGDPYASQSQAASIPKKTSSAPLLAGAALLLLIALKNK